jgi:hypothetical protein
MRLSSSSRMFITPLVNQPVSVTGCGREMAEDAPPRQRKSRHII